MSYAQGARLAFLRIDAGLRTKTCDGRVITYLNDLQQYLSGFGLHHVLQIPLV